MSTGDKGCQLEGMHLASLLTSYGLVQGDEMGLMQAQNIFRMAQHCDREHKNLRPLCDSTLMHALELVQRRHACNASSSAHASA